MLANVKHLDQSLTHSRYPSDIRSYCEYSMSVYKLLCEQRGRLLTVVTSEHRTCGSHRGRRRTGKGRHNCRFRSVISRPWWTEEGRKVNGE